MYTIERINHGQLCIGCGMCENCLQGKVEVTLDKQGKYQVTALDKYTKAEDSLIKALCPVVNYGKLSAQFWGDYCGAFFGYASDSQVRHKASSGGIISATLIYLLEKREIDAVIHVGAVEGKPLRNSVVVSRTRADVLVHSGSRYAPVKVFEKFNEHLNEFGRVALVGRPCDIRAFKNFSQHEELSSHVKYTFAFFCGGIPSEKASERILEELGTTLEEVEKFDYRGNGWPGLTTAYLKNHTEKTMNYDQAWGKILGRDIHRYCKFCMDGLGEQADFGCGDAWHSNEKGLPDFTESDGRNIILCRTDNGKVLLKMMERDNAINLQEIDNVECVLHSIQVGQVYRKSTLFGKVVAMKLLNQYLPNYSLCQLWKWRYDKGIRGEMRATLGTLKRIIQKRL